MQEQHKHIVPVDGIGFTAEAVAGQTLESFIAAEKGRMYLNLPEAERIEKLSLAHQICTDECTRLGIVVTSIPTKPKRKRKPK